MLIDYCPLQEKYLSFKSNEKDNNENWTFLIINKFLIFMEKFGQIEMLQIA